MPKEILIYPPKVFSRNTPRAHETGEAEEVEYDIYKETVRTKQVGGILLHTAGAPGVGHVKYQITRIDETGVYGIEVENTIWVPDGDYYK